MVAILQKEAAVYGLELSVHVSYCIITKQKIKRSLKITALVMCHSPPRALIVQYHHKDLTVYVMEVKFTIKYFLWT